MLHDSKAPHTASYTPEKQCWQYNSKHVYTCRGGLLIEERFFNMTPAQKAAAEVKKIVSDKAYTIDELHDLSGVSRTRVAQTRRDPDTVVDALTFRKVRALEKVYLTQEQKKYTEDEIETVKKMLEKGLASVPQPEKILLKALVDNALEDPSVLLVLLKKARVING